MSSSQTPTRRVAVITGAAMGIGAGIARRLVADGCAVVVNDLPAHEGALSALVAELGGSATTHAYAADVSVEDGVRGLIAAAVEAFGGIDIMVANAGTAFIKPILATSLEDVDRLWDINFHAVFLAYKHAAEQMIKQGRGGRIIGASSISGKKGTPFMAAYSATKFAVRGLTQAAAQEWGAHGITVNSYCPGAIVTPLNDRLAKESAELLKDVLGTDADGGAAGDYKTTAAKSAAVGRVGTVEDVASIVSWLASPGSSFVTGQNILVDGGRVFD